MSRPYPIQADPGAYIPTSEVLDPIRANTIDVNSAEFRNFLNILTRTVNEINIAINLKETGYYVLTEFVNSQSFFPNPTSATQQLRNVFRKVIDFGNLPNNSSKSVAHNIPINAQYTFTRMYGCASIPGTSFTAIPNQDIKLTADTTSVTVTTYSAYAGYTNTYIILEYIKS